jgi:lipopolysaccharide export system permease protein
MLASFSATVAMFALLLLLVRLIDLQRFIAETNGSVMALIGLVGLLAPQYLALAIPVGVLVGAASTFRRFELGGELAALRAAGVSNIRMLRAPLALAVVGAALVLLLAGFLQPLAAYQFDMRKHEMTHGSDGVSVRAGQLTRLDEDVAVRAGGARAGGTELHDIIILMGAAGALSRVVTAERGSLSPGRLRLYDGSIFLLSSGGQRSAFSTFDLPIRAPRIPEFRPRGNHERELTFLELARAARFSDPGDRRAAWSGMARRTAQVLVNLLLPFLGLAAGGLVPRSARSVPLVCAIAAFILYNELSLFAERLGFSGQADSIFAQAAFLSVFAMGVAAAYLNGWRLPAPKQLCALRGAARA